MSEIIKNRSLLSSQARIQVPWVKVTIGDYTFGVFDEKTKSWGKDKAGFYQPFQIQFPEYIQTLEVAKVNGQVNKYTLVIKYPITQHDDPNFFEKVFSSVSRTRKIIFTYGDAETPAYVYKNEEAIITGVRQTFNLSGSSITYTVSAVSAAAIKVDGNIAGYTVGEQTYPGSDTLCIHIEKGLYCITGVYPMLFSSFVKSLSDKFLYVNREDDLDDEGLRYSKLSYNPCAFVEKYGGEIDL
jgi:hypothetical protein